MRYQKIHSQIWNDEKFTGLTPAQQRLFLYILTCPHGNITGFFVLKQGYICDDLKCLAKDLTKDLQKLIDIGFIKYDFPTAVILIRKFLKHNPLTNPNQVKAARKIIAELPQTQLFHDFIEVLPEVLKEELEEVLTKRLAKCDYISVSVSVSDSVSEKIKSITKSEKDTFGKYIQLTKNEYDKLQHKFGQSISEVIEFIDLKIESKGLREWRKQYKSDYATILLWERNGWIKLNGTSLEKPHTMDKIEMAARGLI